MVYCGIQSFSSFEDNTSPASMVAFLPLMIHLAERLPQLRLHKKGRFCTSLLSLFLSLCGWPHWSALSPALETTIFFLSTHFLQTTRTHNEDSFFFLYSGQETDMFQQWAIITMKYKKENGNIQTKEKWNTPISTNEDDEKTSLCHSIVYSHNVMVWHYFLVCTVNKEKTAWR